MDDFKERFEKEIADDYEYFKDSFNIDPYITEVVKLSQQLKYKLKKIVKTSSKKEVSLDYARVKVLFEILKKTGVFTENQLDTLREIVLLRNWTLHNYFLEVYGLSNKATSEEKLIKDIGALNNDIHYKVIRTKHLLFEALDFVDNYIDKQRSPNLSMRPTVIE